MVLNFLRPNNLSQKMMRVIFTIYLGVTFVITCMQFATEYLKAQDSILNEVTELEGTVRGPIATSLWQYDRNQVNVLVDGLIKMPIIAGVDIVDKDGATLVSRRAYSSDSEPLAVFNFQSDLFWNLNNERIPLGSLILYSSSEVVLDRVIFGFSLIVITAVIKLSILFWLFIWAFDRYLANPLKELMVQVNDVQLDQSISTRINLSNIENNELSQLQSHMNGMLSSMERDRRRLLDDEQAKRNWLEEAVAKRTAELQVANEQLKALATRDSLTGALNRGSFFETAQHILVLSRRQKSTASFVLMDLDHFKYINDTYGHFAGDQVLIHFVRTINGLLRESDLIGRVGGEEFALFLPDTDAEAAFQIAEKVRTAISTSRFEVDGVSISYTVSLGIESSSMEDQSVDTLFKRADVKLYGAKDKGRDRVEQ